MLAALARLSTLPDVDLRTTPPSQGQALVYDSASGKWRPGTIDLTSRVAKAGDTMSGDLLIGDTGQTGARLIVRGASNAAALFVQGDASRSGASDLIMSLNRYGMTGGFQIWGDHHGSISGGWYVAGQLRATMYGSASNDSTQDAIQSRPSGALLANWRPFAAYLTSTDTVPDAAFDSSCRLGLGLNSSNGGIIYGFDLNHSIYLRQGGQNVNVFYEYGGTVGNYSRGHAFYTGGLRASQSIRLQIADDACIITNALGINTGAAGPNAAALLDLISTTRGARFPCMTTTQRDAISSPPEGLVIYNLTTHALNAHNGTAWKEVTAS